MGLCSCARVLNVQTILTSFWSSLPIRQKEIKEVVELIKAKKGSIKPIQDKKWLLFQDALLVIVNFKEYCLEIFDRALKEARDKGNEGYLFMSLLFLCKSKDISDFKSTFLKLGETVGDIKHCLLTNEEDKVTKIKLETLNKIILFYINMITLLPCEYLVTFADGNNNFQQITTELFSIDKQKRIVDDYIMKKYKNSRDEDEWVEFDWFFDEYYSLLKDDEKIRSLFADFKTRK